ncbi:hypothetical protein WAI453_010238 [Rhynchosporium graminicola]
MLSSLISPLTLTYHSYPIPTVLIACLFLTTLIIYITSPPRRFSIDLPTLPESPSAQRQRWKWKSHIMLLEGYRKFPGKMFQVWSSEGPEIIVPPEFLDELKGLSDTYLSSIAGLAEMFQSRYTTIPIEDNHFGIHFAKTILTKNLGKVLPGMIEELNYVLPQHFDSYPTRVFVGPNLCRNPSWLQTTESYSKDVFISSSILKIWSISRHNRRAAQIVEEALKDRFETKPKIPDEVEFKESLDATHGIWELLPDELKRDYDFQGRGQLGLAAAGIHTTSTLVTNCIYSLAQFPEYAPILKEEIEDVRRDTGGGEWTLEALGQLKKLESFMKENLRLFASGVTSFRRKVLLPITLTNGTILPVGSYVSAPLLAISIAPSIYGPSSETFSGFRFYNHQPHSDSKQPPSQLTSTTSTSPFFGLGKHACPGRFFAALEAKLLLVEMLRRYEFRLKEGEGRPRDVVFNSLRIVKPGGEVLVRDLKGRKV